MRHGGAKLAVIRPVKEKCGNGCFQVFARRGLPCGLRTAREYAVHRMAGNLFTAVAISIGVRGIMQDMESGNTSEEQSERDDHPMQGVSRKTL
jgi:hypothetical protein